MADDKLRELERALAQDPFDNDARKKWLMTKARAGVTAPVKSYYKIRCGNKWFGNSRYGRHGFYEKTGVRFNTETEAMEALLRFVKRANQYKDPLEETTVELVCFEIHTVTADTKIINLVDASKESALAEIRRQKEELEKSQQELLAKEKELLSGATDAFQSEVRHLKKKLPAKKKASNRRMRTSIDWD